MTTTDRSKAGIGASSVLERFSLFDELSEIARVASRPLSRTRRPTTGIVQVGTELS